MRVLSEGLQECLKEPEPDHYFEEPFNSVCKGHYELPSLLGPILCEDAGPVSEKHDMGFNAALETVAEFFGLVV